MAVPHVAERVDLIHHALRGWPIAHRLQIEGTLRVTTDDTLIAKCEIDGQQQDCIRVEADVQRVRILGNILRNADTAIHTGWRPRPTFHDLSYTWNENGTVRPLLWDSIAATAAALDPVVDLNGPNDEEWL